MARTWGRREFLLASGACAGVTGLGSKAWGVRSSKGVFPNVVYLFSDEHRWQSMSQTEMSELHTPHMAHMAQEGISLSQCISNYPVCSPHRAILMTGRWPYHQRMLDRSPGMVDNNYLLSPEQDTLGKVFQRAGYVTGYIGKWHLGGTRAEPFGFDESLIWTHTNDHWNSVYHASSERSIQTRGYNATLMTDQAIEFMKRHQKIPFFLMVSWNPPHAKFEDAPDSKKALYPEGSLPMRPNVPLSSDTTIVDSPIAWGKNPRASFQGYHAHISAIDDELGRVLGALDDLGLAEDTILIYTSDHGSMMGSHGLASKRQPYEESIRVPFLARWPGKIPQGEVSNDLVGSIDLMPSLAGLAGVPVPDVCEGRDLSSVLLAQPGPRMESQYIMHISKKNASGGENHPASLFRGVTTGRYTYAQCLDRPWCLFDNQEDPFQLKNRIQDAGKSVERDRLHGMLKEWIGRAGDPFGIM